jgi:XapX domain-containing protein
MIAWSARTWCAPFITNNKSMDAYEIAKAVLTGGVAGLVFALMKLPIPAPPVLAGIAGIFGIWLGFMIVQTFIYG